MPQLKFRKEVTKSLTFTAWSAKARSVLSVYKYEKFIDIPYETILESEYPRPEICDPEELNSKEEWIENYISIFREQEVDKENPMKRKDLNTLAEEEYENAVRAFEIWNEQVANLDNSEKECYSMILNSLDENLVVQHDVTIPKDIKYKSYHLFKKLYDDVNDVNEVNKSTKSTEWGNLSIKKEETVKDFSVRVRLMQTELMSLGIEKTETEVKHAFLQGCKQRPSLQSGVQMLLLTKVKEDENLESLASLLQSANEVIRNDSKRSFDKTRSNLNDQKILNVKNKKIVKGSDGQTWKNSLCYNCQCLGHYAKNCPQPNKRLKADQVKLTTEQQNTSSEVDSKVNIKITKVIEVVNGKLLKTTSSNVDDIIIDSGAERSVFKSVFPQLKDVSTGTNNIITFGNDESQRVQSIGTLGNMGKVLVCDKVTDNIVSASQLADSGRVLIITNSNLYVLKENSERIEFKRDDIEFIAKRENGLYKVNFEEGIKFMANGKPVDSKDVA